MARGGLGKGLDADILGGKGLAALLGEDTGEETVKNLRISSVEPKRDQPRTAFDEEKLMELSESIREHGIIQPIAVRETQPGLYEIIAGERRWRAARMAGLTEIPAVIKAVDDREAAELALVENLQREDLSPMEEARGYKALMESYGLTQESAAERVGKSRPVVANALRLLRLPEDAARLVEEKKLPLSHARAVLSLNKPEDMSRAAQEIVREGLSVKQAEKLCRDIAAGKREKKAPDRRHADGVDYYAQVEKELTGIMGRRVTVTPGRKRGKFEIEYYGSEDFERLYDLLRTLRQGEAEK